MGKKKSQTDHGIAKRVLATLLMLLVFITQTISVSAIDFGKAPFTATPQTPYARGFLRLAGGQQWFLDAVERILNITEKSINTLESKSDLDKIITIGAYGLGVEGEIPAAIGEFGNLKYLYLGQNKLSGDIPDELYKCVDLVEIDISGNQLTGEISPKIGALTNLKSLMLYKNGLSGTIPAEIGSLTKLINIDLSSNALTGGIPASLGNLVNAKYINLSDNPLGGEIPKQLGSLTNLTNLYIYECELTGAIPSELGGLSALKTLDLSQNSLTGEFPASFANLTSLEELGVAYNRLSGDLPESITTLTTLKTLDLAYNQFSGAIPASYTNLDSVEILDMSGNRLSGGIPGFLGLLSSLKLLYVNDNFFTGKAPESFVSLSESGGDVNVSNNYLYGNNAGGIGQNGGNFINGGNEQYRLSVEKYTKTTKNQFVNIYNLLENKPLKSGGAKAKLPENQYELVFTGKLDKPSEWFVISGFSVKVLKEIPYSEALTFEVRMLPYEKSEPHIAARFTLGTGDAPKTVAPQGHETPGDDDEYDAADEYGYGEGASGAKPSAGSAATPKPTVAPNPTSKPTATPTPTPKAYNTAYIVGSEGLARPDASMSREEAAAILHRIYTAKNGENSGTDSNYTTSLKDISAGRWSAESVQFAVGEGLMKPRSAGVFAPTEQMTRGEFAFALVRLNGLKFVQATVFADTSNHWANYCISAAANAGYFDKIEGGYFCPDLPITRAQAIVAANRALGRKPDKKALSGLYKPFKDLPSDHFAFWDFVEASSTYEVKPTKTN